MPERTGEDAAAGTVDGGSGPDGQRYGGWLFPYWLERQLDPSSPDYLPGPAVGAARRPLPGGLATEPQNATNRNWTLIGTLGSWHRATVDPRGLVTPFEGGWSLDWWIRADDRWHLPSREAAVRQRLVADAPVVETAMRVPGGDVVHRAYAVRDGQDEHAVIEIENATAVPLAVGLAVRPFHVLGPAWIEKIVLDSTQMNVVVDDRVAVRLPKPPSQVAWSTGAQGDCFEAVMDERTEPPGGSPGPSCPRGLAQATYVFPLAHTAVLRVALPLDPPPSTPRSVRAARSRPDPIVSVGELPGADRVASGWGRQGARGLRLELPDPRLAAAVDTARRHLLLVHGGEDLASVPGQPFDHAEATAVLRALDTYGYVDEVEQLLGTWPERQGSDGWFGGADGRGDANGAALHALADHWRLTRELEGDDELALLVARAAHAIDKRCTGARRRAKGDSIGPPGMLRAGAGPQAGGPPGTWVRDAVWSWQGLHDAIELLTALGQPDAADQANDRLSVLERDLRVTLAALPGGVWPSTIERGADAGIIANLDAVNLTLPLRHGLPGRDETVDAIRSRFTIGPAVHQAIGPAGLTARYSAMLARAEVHLGGDPWGRLEWLLSRASPTWTWAEAAHPTRGGGTIGAGHDGVANAWFLSLVRDLVVRESGSARLAFCSVWPGAWLGQGLEVHDAPTSFGLVSFAVRWHGERPALLWEIETHGDQPEPVVLTVPGLDRSWTSIEPKGEALLGLPVGVADQQIDPRSLEGESFA